MHHHQDLVDVDGARKRTLRNVREWAGLRLSGAVHPVDSSQPSRVGNETSTHPVSVPMKPGPLRQLRQEYNRREWSKEFEEGERRVAEAKRKVDEAQATLTASLEAFGGCDWGISWGRCGFPELVVPNKLFASLACTSMHPSLVPEIGMPWETFVVHIPAEFAWLVRSPEMADHDPYARCTFMVYEKSEAGHLLSIHSGDYQHRFFYYSSRSLAGLLDESNMEGAGRLYASKIIDEADLPCREVVCDDGVFEVYRKAFVGCAIEMMAPRNIDRRTEMARRRQAILRSSTEPSAWTFQLTRQVKVDCREYLHSLACGEGGALGHRPQLQTMVRGHWKRQPCGTKRSARRFIHVEPYWRGPEDAPIAVRAHVLVKPDAQQAQAKTPDT